MLGCEQRALAIEPSRNRSSRAAARIRNNTDRVPIESLFYSLHGLFLELEGFCLGRFFLSLADALLLAGAE
jgi:hypothetical protein